MTFEKNMIPDKVRTVHFIAVCGTGMGSLACMLKDLGFAVTGSDNKVYPPMSSFLAQKGVRVLDGFDPGHLAYGPDLVVVGNAVSRDNPEVVKMLEMGLCFCSMPQAVTRFAARGKRAVVVCGTHGKTTTSALAAWTLYRAGMDPSFIIGGILKDFSSSYRLGKGDVVVIEGDEYDTAFFDKGPKFLHYPPRAAVLTSVEFDHADIYTDLDHVKQAFGRFVQRIPEEAFLAAWDADGNVDRLLETALCRTARYGKTPAADWRLGPVTVAPPETVFDVFNGGRHYGRFHTRLPGEHNLLNTLAVIALADDLGIDAATISSAIASFGGVKRRQEIRGVRRGITVMDDFAHHPTAVRETLRAVKPFCGSGRLIAVFEPRTNSSMRDVFQNVYPGSFDAADLVCIRKPPLLEKIPAGQRFSSEQLVSDLKNRGKEALYFPDTDTLLDFLLDTATAGDTILVMSNGGFDNIHERLLKAL